MFCIPLVLGIGVIFFGLSCVPTPVSMLRHTKGEEIGAKAARILFRKGS
jgi:hypothetical protein